MKLFSPILFRLSLMTLVTAVAVNVSAQSDSGTAVRPSFVTSSVDSQKFVEQAASAGVQEVELAKMALTKSTLVEVRHFAQMMLEDHQAFNRELRKLANAKGLNISDEPTLNKQAKAYVLKLQKGESFDTAYAQNQLESHERTLKLFRQAANSDDVDIKQLADAMVPTLEHHFSMAQALVDTVAQMNSRTSDEKVSP